jgi:hypothetical protein
MLKNCSLLIDFVHLYFVILLLIYVGQGLEEDIFSMVEISLPFFIGKIIFCHYKIQNLENYHYKISIKKIIITNVFYF